jgi:hypothetical protein
MVAAMMLGAFIGTAAHLVIGFVISPLLGMFETMVPGMYIGMHGGMLFAMRDAMQQAVVPLSVALSVGALFGVAVVLVVWLWNLRLRRQMPGPVDPYPAGDFLRPISRL